MSTVSAELLERLIGLAQQQVDGIVAVLGNFAQRTGNYHDAMSLVEALRELQSRRALSGPMAPIARVTVEQRGTTVASGGKLPNHVITRGTMYAPGLPPGEYDLYPEPPQRDPAPEGESA